MPDFDASSSHAPDAPIEVIHSPSTAPPFRSAIFDFDGTLSLFRRNWQDVMIPMMVETLASTGTAESHEELGAIVEEFVMRLNGRQTIYQMIRLSEEVSRRGGTPRTPLQYKHQYHDLLWEQVGRRVAAVEAGEQAADEMLVPGCKEFLAALHQAGITLYLASGTDLTYVQHELDVLGLSDFFAPRIYGALDDYTKFSKAQVIAGIIEQSEGRLLGVGDGFVEVEEVKRVGGTVVGVASNEDGEAGINAWKRRRLIEAGADVIIGDYRCGRPLLDLLGIETPPEETRPGS